MTMHAPRRVRVESQLHAVPSLLAEVSGVPDVSDRRRSGAAEADPLSMGQAGMAALPIDLPSGQAARPADTASTVRDGIG